MANPVKEYTSLAGVLLCRKDVNAMLMKLQKDLLVEQANLLANPVHAEVFPNLDIYTLRKRFNLAGYPSMKVYYSERVSYLTRLNDIQATLMRITRQLKNDRNVAVYAESSISDANMMTGPITTEERVENVTDVVGTDQTFKNIELAKVVPTGSAEKLALSNFFKRPVDLVSGNFDLGTLSITELAVWDLYTREPTVRAKLRNYAYLRGNLHVRVTTTGTPFNYGRLLGSYQPYPKRNSALQYLLASPLTIDSMLGVYANYLSQAKGAFVIDPKENKPVEFVCPFISTKPMHRLSNSTSTVIADTTSYEDLSEAGSLFLLVLNKFQNVQDDTTPIRYFVYAWMEDVELGAPTGTQIQITTESHRVLISAESDEREIGPWENMFSGAAEISGALSQVPYIEPFASAAMMVTSALAGVASIFGWSKPVMIDSPSLVKNVAFQNGAQTIGFDTNYRITLDPKQELTVDPRVTGSSEDEMVINFISAIPSYFTTFTWAPSDVADTPIFTCGVTPYLTTQASGPTDSIMQPTAMCFAAAPFRYWRGEVEYTLEIVASNFHRGKIKITYEPNVNQSALITVDQLNKQFVKIWDIQETQTITLKIGWAYPREWAERISILNDVSSPYDSVEGRGSLDLSQAVCFNGYFVVSVFNPLTDFNDSAVDINVYARCPNLLVNKLSPDNIPIDRNTVSSFGIMVSAESDATLGSQVVDSLYLNESTAQMDTICINHFGERPVSFRALMKRYVTTNHNEGSNANVNSRQFLWDISIMPKSLSPYNAVPSLFENAHFFTYLRYAYMAYRGGIRKRLRFLPISATNAANRDLHAWSRVSLLSESNTDVNNVGFNDYVTASNILNSYANLNGTITMDQDSNGGLEVELPFYSTNLFHFAFATDSIGSNPGGDQNMSGIWVRNYRTIFPFIGLATADQWFVSEDSCTGEDFSFMRFNAGAPYRATGP